jgi:hypothetical protein
MNLGFRVDYMKIYQQYGAPIGAPIAVHSVLDYSVS